MSENSYIISSINSQECLKMKKLATVFFSLAIVLTSVVTGCKADNSSSVSPGDALPSSVVEVSRIDVTDEIGICFDHEKNDEIFILEYKWYGEEFVSDDSLNKTMLDHYAPRLHHAPRVDQDTVISVVFEPSEKLPSAINLTQYGNTVRSDSGLPYDTIAIELVNEDEDPFAYSFRLDYRNLKMYYYLLECQWENGNMIKIAFAVEKPKNQ